MTKNCRIIATALVAVGAVLLLTGLQAKTSANPSGQPAGAEHERVVKESEVPAGAVAAIKRMAGGAQIAKYEEEMENGETFYEGQWKGANGKMEVLVTAQGDVVEMEEVVTADAVPAAVAATAKAAAGSNELQYEKVTEVHYKAKYKQGDQRHKLVVSPTGRTIKTEVKPLVKQ